MIAAIFLFQIATVPPAAPPISQPTISQPTALQDSQSPARPLPALPPVPVYDPTIPNQPPVPSNYAGNWINSNDYPALALRHELEGRVGFDLTIGPDGRVADCVIVQSSGAQILDLETCRTVKRRARFHPATDAKALPTRGSFAKGVMWLIPDGRGAGSAVLAPFGTLPPTPSADPAGWIVENRWIADLKKPLGKNEYLNTKPRLFMLAVDAKGHVADCIAFGFELLNHPMRAANDAQICGQYRTNSRFSPAKDANGLAIAGLYYAHVAVQQVEKLRR
jgi:protein TonB